MRASACSHACVVIYNKPIYVSCDRSFSLLSWRVCVPHLLVPASQSGPEFPMTMCAHSQRLVPLLHDEELDGPLRREVTAHISGCVACTRARAVLERGQEMLREAITEQVEEINFSQFWAGVTSKLADPPQPWPMRWRLQYRLWWPRWALGLPGWAAAATVSVLVFAAAFLLTRPRESGHVDALPHAVSPLTLAASEQAQIESLSGAENVLVWNEPVSNVTVIWVGGSSEGEVP
jgi:anti-sigma factor RsiW